MNWGFNEFHSATTLKTCPQVSLSRKVPDTEEDRDSFVALIWHTLSTLTQTWANRLSSLGLVFLKNTCLEQVRKINILPYTQTGNFALAEVRFNLTWNQWIGRTLLCRSPPFGLLLGLPPNWWRKVEGCQCVRYHIQWQSDLQLTHTSYLLSCSSQTWSCNSIIFRPL